MILKYLIITYDEYLNIPYISDYEQALQKKEIKYRIVLWDRSGQDMTAERENTFIFHGKNPQAKLGKLIPFLRWRRFVLRLLRRDRYDRLVVLTTVPAVLLADQLLGRYSGKYWLDIRDFTYENIRSYKALVNRLVWKAASVSISSKAFFSFLPKSVHFYLAHNLTNDGAEERVCLLDTAKRHFVIAFLGGLRYEKQNRCLLEKLAGSKKYTLWYMGKSHPGYNLPKFCQKHGIENVKFFPAYRNEEKPKLYRDIDLINSIYGMDTEITRLALPNKLYDCALFKKPILVSKGTYLASIVQKYNLGLAVDIETDPVESCLDAYLSTFDRSAFETGCARFLQQVREERQSYLAALDDFCEEKAIP